MKKEIQLTAEFKAQTTKAIFAIIFFALTYLFILLAAVVLTGLCIAGGIFIIAAKPMIATLAIGIGLSGLGVLVLMFLVKFIFKSHKVDRSHLIEIEKSDEPELFKMIENIVDEVRTSHPKKVYLSADVNAAVFYDSSFWSMILPVKKNLMIGIGLVNTVTSEELKAILSHEFGHFSQRTMKVGSYVYNVNQVIFNMLYDNGSFENMIRRWANVSGWFSLFAGLAIKIIEGIQGILRSLYGVVNKRYMALSREMEFHADEIAASVTGYQPLKSSLLRMLLADASYNEVLNFYNGKISENIKGENIYSNQTAVLKYLTEKNNFPLKNGLPDISAEEQSRFDKSKLVIKDQWASHPTTEERIKRLETLNPSPQVQTDKLANHIFKNIVETQKLVTNKLFEPVKYEGEIKFISPENFQNEFRKETSANAFSRIYNSYYNNKNPNIFEINLDQPVATNIRLEELFSDEKVDLVYTAVSLQNDIETLTKISNNSVVVKTFDYDGIRYKKNESSELIQKLKLELENLNERISTNDKQIFEYFGKLESEQNKPKILADLYNEFFTIDKSFNSKYDIYLKLVNDLQFVSKNTPHEQIEANFIRMKATEEILKKEIALVMSGSIYQSEITEEIRKNLESYTSKNLSYFVETVYVEANLDILYSALNGYAYLLSRGYFLMKKKILSYQEELIGGQKQHPGFEIRFELANKV